MAKIERLLEDLAVITKLSDYPGSQDGLSADQFKAKFDEAALIIQDYLNGVIVPALEGVAPDNIDNLPLKGGTMMGAINMAGNKLYNLPTPTNDRDAVPKNYVLPISGGTMTGQLMMGGFRIGGAGYPAAPTDVATKQYVDNTHTITSVLLPASGWSASAPYAQRVELAGITEDDAPHYGVIFSGTNAEKIAQKEAFACVDDMETTADALVFTCFEDKPAVDITVQLELHRNPDDENAMPLMYMSGDMSRQVLADIEGETYGVDNATINTEPTAGTYDFTVI